MSNPFPSKFNSACNWCGDVIEEGDSTFAIEGNFVCRDCANESNNICECGNYKKSGFDECYDCHNDNELV